jgi:hypothetical protein
VSLSDWLANRWIVSHEPSREEIADLFAVVDRDLKDAAVPRLSADWRLGIAYNAALQLATLALAGGGVPAGPRTGSRTRDSVVAGYGGDRKRDRGRLGHRAA